MPLISCVSNTLSLAVFGAGALGGRRTGPSRRIRSRETGKRGSRHAPGRPPWGRGASPCGDRRHRPRKRCLDRRSKRRPADPTRFFRSGTACEEHRGWRRNTSRPGTAKQGDDHLASSFEPANSIPPRPWRHSRLSQRAPTIARRERPASRLSVGFSVAMKQGRRRQRPPTSRRAAR